jgi:hypothetical protein
LVGRYGLFEPWAFVNWAATTWVMFSRVRGAFIAFIIFREKGLLTVNFRQPRVLVMHWFRL